MNVKCLTALLVCCASALFAASPTPTLDLKFNAAQKVGAPNQIELPPGNAQGWLTCGKKGYLIPAKNLTGTAGALLVQLRQNTPLDPKQTNRVWISLCTNSRTHAGVSYIPTNGKYLSFHFGDYEHQVFSSMPKNSLEFGHAYWLGLVWDGNKVSFYVDGKLFSEHKQPLPMEKVSYLAIGPYNDKWRGPAAWADDTEVHDVKLFNAALTPDEVAALCGAKVVPAAEQYPAVLTVNSAAQGKPVMDGKLDEAFWKQGTALPQLVHISKPQLSFRTPEGGFRMAADKNNLYLGFRYIIPAGNAINAGQQRTATVEPEVWNSESFEFYLAYKGDCYRFAGNVAGGFIESKNNDNSFNGAWTYKSSLSMQIDNTQLWQGEVAIPWKTLGLNGIPESGLSMNYCRTWCLADCSAATSLTGAKQYSAVKTFIPLAFAPGAPAVTRESMVDPSKGLFQQQLNFYAPKATKLTCDVALAKANGMAEPLLIVSKQLDLKAGEVTPVTLDGRIETVSYDALLWTVKDKDKVLARQIVPITVSENFLDVAPRFLSGHLAVKTQLTLLQGKFGAKTPFAAVLLNPDGKELARKTVTENSFSLPFDSKNPAGVYKVKLLGGDKMLSEVALSYPGLGEWATAQFPKDVILPPFTPLKATKNRASMWGRTYDYTNSLLPRSIQSQDTELLLKPAALVVNGEELTKAVITPGQTQNYRTEYTAKANGKGYAVTESSWIEYDGVSYNSFTVKARTDLKDIKVRFTLPAALAKYIHANYGGAWGTKITKPIAAGHTDYSNYPILWLGMEDKGLCLFFEHTDGWTESRKAQWSIDKDGEKAVLELHLKDALKAGETFAFELGYVATPVKKQTANFPLNSSGDEHTALMHRPGHCPVNSFFTTQAKYPHEIDNYFADLPDMAHSIATPYYEKLLARAKQAEIKTIVYTDAMMVQNEYPEVSAFGEEWRAIPGDTLPYTRDGKKYENFRSCPRTGASALFALKIRELLKRYPFNGVYFDFGCIGVCNNPLHGCNNSYPFLAMREFYRRIALVQYQSGIKEPLISLHNTDYVQVPVVTFATHLLNGEHIRQHSSTIMHNGKDILDTYNIEMFASELSSLPFGLTNTVYQSNDVLRPEFGGGKEDPELYKFRITQAFLAGVLPHNTILSQSRCHYGILDKVHRTYEAFGVPQAKFVGYWNNPATVKGGKDIYVSCYVKDGKVLAVVSHIGKEHVTQNIEITFDWAKLGVKPLTKAVDKLQAPDPDYEELYALRKKYRVPNDRAPLKLGDFGSKIQNFSGNTLKMELKFHTFALIELTK